MAGNNVGKNNRRKDKAASKTVTIKKENKKQI